VVLFNHGCPRNRVEASSPLGLLADRQAATPDAVPVDDYDRMLEIQRDTPGQDSIHQIQHLCVRVRPTSEEDDAGPVRLLEGEQARVVEVRGDDDPSSRRATSTSWLSLAYASPAATAWTASWPAVRSRGMAYGVTGM